VAVYVFSVRPSLPRPYSRTLAWELASAGELLIHPGKPICNGLIAAMSAACEVFAFTPRPWRGRRLTSRLVNV
jgi:hypothetical protein